MIQFFCASWNDTIIFTRACIMIINLRILYYLAESHFAESRFAKSYFAESRFAESYFTESYIVESRPFCWTLSRRTQFQKQKITIKPFRRIPFRGVHFAESCFTFQRADVAADHRSARADLSQLAVDCVWDLGVLIDSNMTLSNHVNNVTVICFYQLRQLRIIRRSLTTESDAAHSLVWALIHTRVDYCKWLLAAGPEYTCTTSYTVRPPRHRQTCSAAPTSCVCFRNYARTVALARDARSCPIQLCALVYWCLHGLAPYYLSDLCTHATVQAHLRSYLTLERSLSIPRMKSKALGPRGFYVASSAAWNAFPVSKDWLFI